MNRHERINEKLVNLMKSKKISDFRLISSDKESVTFGSTGEKLGGAYDPVHFDSRLSGEIMVEWEDGTISKSNITSSWLKDFEKNMKVLYELRYKDEADKNYLEKQDVSRFTSQASKTISEQSFEYDEILVEKIEKLKKWMSELKEKVQYTGVWVSSQNRRFSNSQNNDLEEEQSFVGLYGSLGEKIGFDISGRELVDLDKMELFMDRTEVLYKAMQNSYSGGDFEGTKVIFDPDVWWSIFNHFILYNISGSALYYKQSCFNIEDFESNKSFAPESLDLTIYPNLEMTVEARNFSSEGWVYPGKYTFIENGSLVAPIANHRFSKLLSVEPSPGISSQKLVDFGDVEESESIDDIVADTTDGVHVTAILGLHTRDSSSGEFSLVAPNLLVVKDGEYKGRVELMIRGNMFDILKNLEVVYRDPLSERTFVASDMIEVGRTG